VKPRYSVRDISKASPTKPLPEHKQRYQLTKMLAAFDEIARGEKPTVEHWMRCSDAVNMMDALIEMNICQDASGLLDEAHKAMTDAQSRGYRLSGSGMQAVRAVIEDYAEAMKHVSERTMLAAHRRAELKIIAQIKRGRPPEN
jgi:hypothetical protein